MVKTTEFNVQTQMNYVVGNMSGFTAAYTGMDNLSALISSLMTSYTTLAGTGRAAYVSMGAAVAAFGLKSAEAFGEFQRGMNIVKAIGNATNAQMQMLSQTANQFSSQFRMDISEINDGLTTLGRAGLTDVNNQIQVLQNGLQVAKLEGMDLAATLEDIVTTTSLLGGDVTSNNFGAQSTEVSNLLVATSLSGPLDVGDVIETLKFAGGSAAAAGANLNNEEGLKDLLGTIGAFSQKGVIGSIAGTALRAFITKPASQDATVKNALAELGLDAYSLWEKDEENGWQMKPIAEQIGLITDAMDKQHMTNLDRIEVWGDIVGNKMGQQMLKLDENKIKDVTSDIEHQRNLEEIYQGTLTNFASQVERLNQIFQSIYRNIGSGFASMLTGVVQGLASILEFFNNIGNGALFKLVAPILGPLGLAGLSKGLKDVIQILGALKTNIKQSINKPIKAQPLYQPYEDWIVGGDRRGYAGVVESSGTISVTGPTTIHSSGNFSSYKSFTKSLADKYDVKDYRDTPEWQAAELKQREILNENIKSLYFTRPGNILSGATQYDITMEDPSKFSEQDLANLQRYESYKTATKYLGQWLLRNGTLLDENHTLTEEALESFSRAMGGEQSMNSIRNYARKASEQMSQHYRNIPIIDPYDPKGERINPQYASKMVDIVTKRMLSAIFRSDYKATLGPEANFYDFIEKGMNTDLFQEYLKIPVEKFKEEAAKKGWVEGTPEYAEGLDNALAMQSSMRNLGPFLYLNTTGQTSNVSQLALDAVNRGLEGLNLENKINSEVQDELNRTKASIEADKSAFQQAGAALGGSLADAYVQQGLGRHSPGYMYWETVAEFELIQRFISKSASMLGTDGKIAGSSIVEAFKDHPQIVRDIDSMKRYSSIKPELGRGILSLDLETTGTNFFNTDLNKNDGITQIGAVMFDSKSGEIASLDKWGYKTGGLNTIDPTDREALKEKNAIIRYRMADHKVENVMNPEASIVSGIDYETFDGAFTSEEKELKNFAKYIEKVLGTTIERAAELGMTIQTIAHNGEFDINALSQTIERVNRELTVAGKEKIPDFTKVLSLIDTKEVGKRVLQERYGSAPLQGFGADGSLSLGIRYINDKGKADFVGNNKQETYGRMYGLTEVHDGLVDALDNAKIYLNFAKGDLPEGFLAYGPTHYKPGDGLITYNVSAGKALNPMEPDKVKDMESTGAIIKESFIKDIRAYQGMQRSINAEQESNYATLVAESAKEAQYVKGLTGMLDAETFRLYGPIDEVLKELKILERVLGPGIRTTVPRPTGAPEGYTLAGFTPYSFINNLGKKFDQTFHLEEELIPEKEIYKQTAPNSPTRSKGQRSGSPTPKDFNYGKIRDNEIEDNSLFADDNKYKITGNLHEARYNEFSDAFNLNFANTFNNIISYLSSNDIGPLNASKRARLDKELAVFFKSPIFELAEIDPIIPGNIRIAQDAYNKIHIAEEEAFYEYGTLRKGFSEPQALTAQRALALQIQGFDELRVLEEPLQQWFRNLQQTIGKIITTKSLPGAEEKPDPRLINQALLKLYNPKEGDLGSLNDVKNKSYVKHYNQEYERGFSDKDVMRIANNLATFNSEGKIRQLTPLGEAFYEHYQFSGSKVNTIDDLSNKITNLLINGKLLGKFGGEEFLSQENNSHDTEEYLSDELQNNFSLENKHIKEVDDILTGKFKGLATREQMVDYVNKSVGAEIWSMEDGVLKKGSDMLNYPGSNIKKGEIVDSLKLMEKVFKENTGKGFYYNYKDVNPMTSMKTIEDVNAYNKMRQLYKNTTGLDWMVDPDLERNKVKAEVAELYRKDIEEGYFEKDKSGKYKRVKDGGRIQPVMNRATYAYHDPNITSKEKGWAVQEAQRRVLNIYDPKLFNNDYPIPEFVNQLKDLPEGIEKYVPAVQQAAKRLGEGFVKNFRDAVGFHSPIRVIDDFNKTLDEQTNEMGEIIEGGAEKVREAAEKIATSLGEIRSHISVNPEDIHKFAEFEFIAKQYKSILGNQFTRDISKTLTLMTMDFGSNNTLLSKITEDKQQRYAHLAEAHKYIKQDLLNKNTSRESVVKEEEKEVVRNDKPSFKIKDPWANLDSRANDYIRRHSLAPILKAYEGEYVDKILKDFKSLRTSHPLKNQLIRMYMHDEVDDETYHNLMKGKRGSMTLDDLEKYGLKPSLIVEAAAEQRAATEQRAAARKRAAAERKAAAEQKAAAERKAAAEQRAVEKRNAERVENIKKLANRPKRVTAKEFLERRNSDKPSSIDSTLEFDKSPKKQRSEEKLQQRNQRVMKQWTDQLVEGTITQEQYTQLLTGLIPSGRDFNLELKQARTRLEEHYSRLMKMDVKDQESRMKEWEAISKEIAVINEVTAAKEKEAIASKAAAQADIQQSRIGRISSGLATIIKGVGGLASKIFNLMMNPIVMVGQIIMGYAQQIIEWRKQAEEEKISKLSEISSNADSAFDEQQSKWEEAQAKDNEDFNDLSDNEKQDQMLEAIAQGREDFNNASGETKALIGKQNELISASNNLIEQKSKDVLTGYDGLQAKYTELMEGSGMYGTTDEFGLMDFLESIVNPDKLVDNSNTRRLDALTESSIQIDTRVKNMEEFTEDYQQVMASMGMAHRSLLDIYNVRGIMDESELKDTFFDQSPSNTMRIGSSSLMSAEKLAAIMQKQEKTLQRFENRYVRFTKVGTGKDRHIEATLGDGSIHKLATQLGLKDIEAAQVLAVHQLQRIQDVMINQVEPELAQQTLGIYNNTYQLGEANSKSDVQTMFQNTMTKGILAIQMQVAQLVYKAIMERALEDYQAETGDTETNTVGLLLNKARDTSAENHEIAKKYSARGWGSYLQNRDVNELVNQGYTEEQAKQKLAQEKGVSVNELTNAYAQSSYDELGKYGYNGTERWLKNNAGWIIPAAATAAGAIGGSLILPGMGTIGGAEAGGTLATAALAALGITEGVTIGAGTGAAIGGASSLAASVFGETAGSALAQSVSDGITNFSDPFSEYTNEMMRSYANNIPLDSTIEALNDAQVAADEEGNNGSDTDDSDANKQRYVQLAICNKKAIPKLNVNLFKKAPTFTVLNKNFKLRDIKINTADKAKNIENSLKNAIIDVQERSDPKIIQDSEAEYDPVGATDDATNLPTGASLTK